MDPIGSRPTPLAQRLRRQPPPGLTPQPADHVELSAEEPTRKPARLAFRLLKVAGLTASAGASLLGGIAYHANHEALTQPPSVHIYPQKLDQPAGPASQPLSQAAVQARSRQKPGPVSVLIPSDTVTGFMDNLQQTPEVKKLLAERIQQAEQALQQQLTLVKVPDGEVLVDVSMPLPTSDRSALHLGGLDLPSLGYRALQQETVPLSLSYSTQPIETGLQVRIQPVKPDAGLKGPGVLLGAVNVQLHAPQGKVDVRGKVDFNLDLDGEATRERIEKLRAMGGQEELVSQLQTRLAQGEKLQRLGQEQGFRQVLQSGFGHEVQFEAEIQTGTGPLAQTTFYLWATPDSTGDGKADVRVTQMDQLQGLDGLKVELRQLATKAGDAPEGKIAKLLHAEAERGLLKGLRQAVPQLTGELQKLARDRAQKEFVKGAPKLEQASNQQLQQLYERNGKVKLQNMALDLNTVQITPQGVLVDLQQGSGSAEVARDLRLKPGQFAVAVDFNVLNRQLQKTDWNALLQNAKQKANLRELSFTSRPQLQMQDGRLSVSFEVVARMNGAKPLKGATGVVTGVTGALDGGLEKVQKGLKKDAGPVGNVIGTVLRAPFFVVDKVAGGGKAVIDNTVGKVVDAVPEVATRPTVHTRVSIPLQLSVEDGALSAKADGSAVQFQQAQSKLPFDLLDVLPTRMLSNAIVNSFVEAQGPAKVGNQVHNQGVELDLQSSLGIRFEEVRLGNDGDVTAVLRFSPKTAQQAASKTLR